MIADLPKIRDRLTLLRFPFLHAHRGIPAVLPFVINRPANRGP
jgi:hypothetical protein